MSRVIYQFSGTGNSLKVARDIAGGIGGAEVIALARAGTEELSPSVDTIGIVFPVYAWGPPAVVLRFIDRLAVPGNAYVFAVCTCAGSAGGALGIVERALAKKGVTLSSGFTVKMPTNYIVWGDPIPKEKQREVFAAASERIRGICGVVSARQEAPVEKGKPLARFFLNGIYRFSIGHFTGMDKKFFADDKCDGCGICVKVCQVGNVHLEEGRPRWHHNCEACLACLQFCPREAIQYGNKTAGRKRYHHPDIKASDLF